MAEKDQTLVQKVLKGDHHAFGDLMERYVRLVRGVIWETLRKPDEIEDLVQEVFFKAYTQLHTLRQPRRFAAWLWQIAANTVVSHQQRKRTMSAGEQHIIFSLYPHPRRHDEVVEENEEFSLMWTALDRLEPDYRRIVVLFYFEECGHSEIARFLDLPLTTVRWRLYKARNLLRDEMLKKLGHEVQGRLQEKRRLREKMMALLPVAAFLHPQPRRWLERWAQWKYWALGTAASLGIGGLAYFQPWATTPPPLSREAQRTQAQARLTADPLVEWTPLRPRAGQQVRISAADLEVKEGDQAELHYLTDPEHPLDHVVPLTQEGKVWAVDLEVPKEAVAVFFYIAPRREGPQRLDYEAVLTTRKLLKRYVHALLVHDRTGKPVQNAIHTLALMAQRQEKPTAEILAYGDRELALYPEHFETYMLGWLPPGTEEYAPGALKQVKVEQQALLAKYPGRPEVLWWVARAPTPWQDSLYQELYRRFPTYESKYESKDAWAFNKLCRFYTGKSKAVYLAALEEFPRLFPDSPYVDETYRLLLTTLAGTDPGRAGQLADSLIDHTLYPSYDPQKEKTQRLSEPPNGAHLPEGWAYILRFELCLNEGKPEKGLALAQRLISSGLRDPNPYLYLGQRLAGQEYERIFSRTSSTCPLDLSLSLQVLEAGLPLATPENQLELPGYNFALSSEQIGEEMRKLYLEEIHILRQTFLQTLARDYMALGAYGRALPRLEASAELYAEIKSQVAQDDLTFLLLGEVYEGLGRWEEAQEAYLRAIAQNYSQPEAEAALRRMHQERYGDLEQLQPLLQACHPPAPAFTLKDTLGQEVRLSDFKGKVLVLYYDPVRAEDLDKQREQIDKRYGVLKGWVDKFQAQGFEVLHVRQYSGHLPSPFRMVLDEDGVADKYGLRDRLGWQPPAMILIDQGGRLRRRRQYDSYSKEAEWDLQLQKKIEEVLQEPASASLRPVVVSGTQ